MTDLELREAVVAAAKDLRSGELSHADVANWLLDLDARLRETPITEVKDESFPPNTSRGRRVGIERP